MGGSAQLLKGVFSDSSQGLEYQTQTMAGLTDDKGGFEYRPGETVTFSVGGVVLGSAYGGKRLTPAHIVLEVGGDPKWIRNNKVTNISRFLQGFSRNGNIENGIVVTDAMRDVIRRFRYKIDFAQSDEAFGADPEVNALFAELEANLPSPAQARNHLRRTLHGIKKLADVKVPTRDGSYLLADVYRPIEEGTYPVVMSLAGYGKAFWFGCICSDEDLLKVEEREDSYFEGAKAETPFIHFHFEIAGQVPPPELPPMGSPPNPPLPHVSEFFELPNTMDWVPRGYAVVLIDGRGSCRTPGMDHQFSLQEAEDNYDAIEWAGHQEWSNGNVGLHGASLYAMTMFNTAQLQPPSLKAMIPINGDIDSYRDYLFTGGGLYNPFNFIAKLRCGEWQGVDFISEAQAHPFYDPEIYGPKGTGSISPDVTKITQPFWSSLGLELPVHTRGASEAYIHCASQHKKLTILSEPGIHFWMFAPEFLEEQVAFFDYWLKGVSNGIMDRPPVRMMIRTGRGGYYWQDEQDWPVARTQYVKYYLDAGPSARAMRTVLPAEEHSSSYAADAPEGVSFVTDPMTEDTVIAGYIKLVAWVSSTSHDMAIGATIRVIDENDVEVAYAIDPQTTKAFAGGRIHPLGKGALKVSHRKLDPERSTVYRPFHTHLEKDYQPLVPGEAVECEVEFWPTTALIKKGWRIRLDVMPGLDPLDGSYQKHASNTIYTGPKHLSYLQLPSIPEE